MSIRFMSAVSFGRVTTNVPGPDAGGECEGKCFELR